MSSESHTAYLLHGARDMRATRVETPKPQSHEVMIRPRATGICGTDMHYYQNGRNGIFTVSDPLCLGHEAAGEVVAVGTDVKDVRVGDRLAIEPQRPCVVCKQCKTGTYNLCPNMKFSGSASAQPPVQGSLQELFCHSAAFVHKIPDKMSWVEGAMVEPLSVAIHASRRSGLRAGQSVMILGAGAIGLLCAAVSRLSGAESISMIDIDEGRLKFAQEQNLANATYTIPIKGKEGESKPDFASRVAKEVLAQQGFKLADVVFECTGVETCVNIGIHCAERGGKVVLVGMGSPVQSINIGAAAVREVDLLGLWRYANTFDAAIGFIQSGQLDVKSLVTHTFPLEKSQEALEIATSRPANLIKCVITSD